MKLKTILTISLAATISAATIGVGTAFAAEQPAPTVYPDNFMRPLEFEGGLTDYAVYGDTYAFAYNGQLAVLNGNGNNERLPDIKPVSSITELDYSAEGKLYVCFADGYCVYPDLENKLPLSQITVQGTKQWSVSIGSATYALNNAVGSIQYQTQSGFEQVTADGAGDGKFSILKKYGNTAYTVMNNSLYRLDGAKAVKVDPTYYAYIDLTKAIPTGTAAQALKAQSQITMGWIEKGMYYTEISLQNGLGATFNVPDPATATRLSEDRLYSMVLAESGNAYIVALGDKCYLTAKSSVNLEAESPILTAPDVSTAYAIEKTGVYSRPYISEATKLCDLESGSAHAVSVLGQCEFADKEFYKVEYTVNGEKVTGYTAKGLMTGYAFPAEDEALHPDGGDKEFVYDTNVVTVALAVAIVALVIIAILYVAAASAKRNKGRKKKKQTKKKSADDDDEDDYE